MSFPPKITCHPTYLQHILDGFIYLKHTTKFCGFTFEEINVCYCTIGQIFSIHVLLHPTTDAKIIIWFYAKMNIEQAYMYNYIEMIEALREYLFGFIHHLMSVLLIQDLTRDIRQHYLYTLKCLFQLSYIPIMISSFLMLFWRSCWKFVTIFSKCAILKKWKKTIQYNTKFIISANNPKNFSSAAGDALHV